MQAEIRSIERTDNAAIASIIRQVLTEFGADKPGFAWQDPELDLMFEAYDNPRSSYLIALVNGKIVGGAGIAPLPAYAQETCELQKMYLLPESRGLGLGEALMTELVKFATGTGFQFCYLETLHSMQKANELYKRFEFKALPEPLADTGHNSCDSWLIKML